MNDQGRKQPTRPSESGNSCGPYGLLDAIRSDGCIQAMAPVFTMAERCRFQKNRGPLRWIRTAGCTERRMSSSLTHQGFDFCRQKAQRCLLWRMPIALHFARLREGCFRSEWKGRRRDCVFDIKREY